MSRCWTIVAVTPCFICAYLIQSRKKLIPVILGVCLKNQVFVYITFHAILMTNLCLTRYSSSCFRGILFSTYFTLDWELEADGIVCSGSEIYKGRASTVESCGKMCKGISKWFILAKCPMPVDEGCSCYCETSIDSNNLPICDKVSNNNFRLYKLKGKASNSY